MWARSAAGKRKRIPHRGGRVDGPLFLFSPPVASRQLVQNCRWYSSGMRYARSIFASRDGVADSERGALHHSISNQVLRTCDSVAWIFVKRAPRWKFTPLLSHTFLFLFTSVVFDHPQANRSLWGNKLPRIQYFLYEFLCGYFFINSVLKDASRKKWIEKEVEINFRAGKKIWFQ